MPYKSCEALQHIVTWSVRMTQASVEKHHEHPDRKKISRNPHGETSLVEHISVDHHRPDVLAPVQECPPNPLGIKHRRVSVHPT